MKKKPRRAGGPYRGFWVLMGGPMLGREKPSQGRRASSIPPKTIESDQMTSGVVKGSVSDSPE